MFVYYYVYVNLPFSVVERRLLDQLASSADDWAADAYDEGEALRVKLGLGAPEPRIGKSARVTVARPYRSVGETAVPITWETAVPIHVEATGLRGLFPRLDADIVAAGLGPELTQLAIRGSYRPPLGVFGRTIDRAILHRIAEASVKGFLDRIKHSIERNEAAVPAVLGER